ncbi:hypothetical protein ABK040_011161 [Willaertia magna]
MLKSFQVLKLINQKKVRQLTTLKKWSNLLFISKNINPILCNNYTTMNEGQEQSEESNNSDSSFNNKILIYRSKYHSLLHKLILNPYQRYKTHILNGLFTSAFFYSIYQYDLDVNLFIQTCWLASSFLLSYKSSIDNKNHIPIVVYKIEWDKENKILYLFNENNEIIDKITDLRNLIIDHEMNFKLYVPFQGFFWKSFLFNKSSMEQKLQLKFLHYNPQEVKRRMREGKFILSNNNKNNKDRNLLDDEEEDENIFLSESMRKDKIGNIDPETGVIKQYVYTIVNDKQQHINDLRDDLIALKEELGVRPKW